MAEQIFLELFRSVDGQMANLTTTMGAQGVAKIVKPFDGSNPKEFKEWVKSIEKFATLTRVAPDRIKLIAYQASKGPVSDFIKRHLEQHADHTWAQVKAELKSSFGEVVDAQHALLLLRKVKQKVGETVQVYAERLLNLGEDAFEGQDVNAVQRQLVGYFIDGLREDNLKLKIMRENPDTFQAALATATREQNLRRRFQLRTGHSVTDKSDKDDMVPMEVDHFRNKPRCHYCQKKGHIIRDCRARKRDRQVNITAVRKEIAGGKKHIICYKCRSQGHFARDCPQNQAIRGSVGGQGRSDLNANPSHM